jgi:chemotaxis protein methyltransferase CheR
MTDQEYAYLKKKVLNITGIDLDCYKSQQMRRRLDSFIESSLSRDVTSYCQVIEQDESSLRKLCDFLTINVTEFFRDDWAFLDLQKTILPMLTKNASKVNIWSAGCSNGAEVYTIAILLNESVKKVEYRIVGTDMDELSLEKARNGGPYREDFVKNMPKYYISRYMNYIDGNYWIKDELKDKLFFRRHNLLSDPFEKGFDMIVCRNVTIYFTDEAKDRLNRHFHESLKDGGVLFIGATEFIMHPGKTGFNKIGTSFYQKMSLAIPVKTR